MAWRNFERSHRRCENNSVFNFREWKLKQQYNSLKKRVLRELGRRKTWVSVPEIARKVGLAYSERGLYPYLRRLEAMGLVQAGKNSVGRLFYRATERGAERLKVLNERG